MSLCSWRLFSRKGNSFNHGGGKYNFSSCWEAELDNTEPPTLGIHNSEVSLPLLLFFAPPVLEPDKSFTNRDLIILLPGSSDSNIVSLTTITTNLTWAKGSQWSHPTFFLPFNSLFSSINSQLLQGGLFFYFLFFCLSNISVAGLHIDLGQFIFNPFNSFIHLTTVLEYLLCAKHYSRC